MADKCCVEWCKGVPNRSGKGYCRKHYDQIRKYGYILDKRSKRDSNRIEIAGDIAKIIITDSKDNYICSAIIDREDVEKVKEHRWTTNGRYIRCFLNGSNSPTYLHRFVLNYSGDLEVDHINRDRNDNRKSNLRICDRNLNASNRQCKGYINTNRRLKKPFLVSVKTKGINFQKYVETEEEAKKLAYDKRVEFGIYPQQKNKIEEIL